MSPVNHPPVSVTACRKCIVPLLVLMLTANGAGQWPTHHMLVDSVYSQFVLASRQLDMASTSDTKWHLVYSNVLPIGTPDPALICYLNSDSVRDTIARGTDLGLPSIAADPEGFLHAAYVVNVGLDTLMYVNNRQGTWGTPYAIATFDQRMLGLEGADMAVDASGHWHVIYQEMGDGVNYLVYRNSESDSVWRIDSLSTQWLGPSSIACDHNPPYDIHVAYYRPISRLIHRTLSSEGWSPRHSIDSYLTSSTLVYMCSDVDIAIDNEGHWHVVYERQQGTTSTTIKYASSEISPTTIATSSEMQLEKPGLTVDGNQQVHVTWFVIDGRSRYIDYLSSELPTAMAGVTPARSATYAVFSSASVDLLGRMRSRSPANGTTLSATGVFLSVHAEKSLAVR